MKRKQKRNLPRLIIQWTIIIYLIFLAVKAIFQENYAPDFEAYCPFGGIQSLTGYFLNNSMPCTMTSAQAAMGVMLILGIILFSKLFCSYICPVGTLSEWLGNIGRKYKFSRKVPVSADLFLRSLKYLLLFVTFYITLNTNELFCKKYDPFFAVAGGFSNDVIWYYAISTIAMVVIGSLLFRLFWCKYLCPLGAISNILQFSWLFVAVLSIYGLILAAGVQLSLVWPLALLTISGYLLEIRGQKLKFYSITKITRKESTCTDCQLCSKRCPQSIDVAKMQVVTDVDCNLCGECLEACPEKDTLQLNSRSKLKWLPPIVVVGLVILGLVLGAIWEIPTIDQRWGSKEAMAKANIYNRSPVSEITCYGTSLAFAARMKEVKGVLGVATFVSTHKITILYDAAEISVAQLEATLFTPQKTVLARYIPEGSEVKVVTCQMENFFDPADFRHLAELLKERTDALLLESEYSCPVTVRIYLPLQSAVNEAKLGEIMAIKSMDYSKNGQPIHLELSFRLKGTPVFSKIPERIFRHKRFEPYDNTFNWKSNYQESRLDTFAISCDASQGKLDSVSYLVSYLSNDTGIVGFHSSIDSSERVNFKIIYIDSLTNTPNILKKIKNDTLTINYEGGEVGKIKNMFKFTER
jgi:Pyruvate/2-oxoacid:ferredoxin oxidoreductase delta subunit